MIQCGQLFAGSIVAARAGFVSIPADFRTGGGFCCVLHQIMVQRGQLCAGGIAAAQAGTGIVSPALFCAGGGLRYVTHQIMVQCGQLFAGGIAAADAEVVSVPADFRTGGGFCTGMHQSMVIGVFFAVFPPHTSQTALAVQVAVPPVQLAVLTSEQRVQLPVCVPLPLGVHAPHA